jgi:hypothetical protein
VVFTGEESSLTKMRGFDCIFNFVSKCIFKQISIIENLIIIKLKKEIVNQPRPTTR